jgi:hypothetical protein
LEKGCNFVGGKGQKPRERNERGKMKSAIIKPLFSMFFALFSPWHDTYDKRLNGCHANRASVITTRGEKHEICWNEPETAVTLHRQSDKTTFFDLLIQNKYK